MDNNTIALNNLLRALSKNGYVNYHKQHHDNGDLWQKKDKNGCFFNFYVYKHGNDMPVDMVGAEVRFQCSEDGQWCQHILYGLPVSKMAKQIPQTEKKLLAVFTEYGGQKYI